MAAATATKTASVQEPAAAAKLQVASVSEPQYARFFAGGLASATAEIFTLPIDCTKVRLQAQRAVSIPMMTNVGMVTARQEVQYNGMLNAVQTIVKEEGPGALWKGATPALLRQVSYTSICMVLYEPLRDLFGANQANKSDVPFVNRFLAGGFAGAIGISIANPYVLHALLLVSCIAALIARQIVPLDGREYLILHVLHCNSVDVIKVRMQADRTGTLYRGVGDAVSKIYQREGFRGFLRVCVCVCLCGSRTIPRGCGVNQSIDVTSFVFSYLGYAAKHPAWVHRECCGAGHVRPQQGMADYVGLAARRRVCAHGCELRRRFCGCSCVESD